MKNLALTFLLATATLALTTATTAPATPRATVAMACCDDPPPPCWPTGQCDDKQNPPDGGSNRSASGR